MIFATGDKGREMDFFYKDRGCGKENNGEEKKGSLTQQ